MKFGFVTCVQLGLSCMEAIYKVGGELEFVISTLDEQGKHKSGRVYLDDFCEKNSVQLHKSSHINNQDCIDLISESDIDWLFIIGWSQIAGSAILKAPNKGVLGIHPTLLPEGRGRAAIPWAILKGLDKTGVTLFKLDEGVDTGEIVSQLQIPLNSETTAATLYESVNQAHVSLIESVFNELKNDTVTLIKQDEDKATVWPGRKPEEGEIDLTGSVVSAERLVRAVTHPYPGAFVHIGTDKYIVWKSKIVNAKTSNLCLEFEDGFLECIDWTQL